MSWSSPARRRSRNPSASKSRAEAAATASSATLVECRYVYGRLCVDHERERLGDTVDAAQRRRRAAERAARARPAGGSRLSSPSDRQNVVIAPESQQQLDQRRIEPGSASRQCHLARRVDPEVADEDLRPSGRAGRRARAEGSPRRPIRRDGPCRPSAHPVTRSLQPRRRADRASPRSGRHARSESRSSAGHSACPTGRLAADGRGRRRCRSRSRRPPTASTGRPCAARCFTRDLDHHRRAPRQPQRSTSSPRPSSARP